MVPFQVGSDARGVSIIFKDFFFILVSDFSIDVLDRENQPVSGALGLTEEV